MSKVRHARRLLKGARERHGHGPGRGGTEILFVPVSWAGAEDDGWPVTGVIGVPTDAGEVLTFHAKVLSGGPAANIRIPYRHIG